jgi:hypothetical protein
MLVSRGVEHDLNLVEMKGDTEVVPEAASVLHEIVGLRYE